MGAPGRDRLAGLLLAAVVAVGCAGDGGATAEPPLPHQLEAIDPDLAQLIRDTAQAIRDRPGDASAWMRLGLTYQGNSQYDLGRVCFERAVALDPAAARGWYHLGLTRYRTGDGEGAVAAAAEAGRLDPRYAPAQWQRGLWLLELGRVDEAEAAFREATRIDARDPAGWAGLSRVHLLREQPEQAVKILERLLAAYPRQPYLHHLLGTAFRMLGEREKAEAALIVGRNSLPLWPDPWAQEQLAYRVSFESVLEEATRALNDGRPDIAVPALESLRRKQPQHRVVLTKLGQAYLLTGRLDEGLATFETMVGFHADSFLAQLEMATALETTGQLDRALTHVDRGIELHPKRADLYRRRGSILLRRHDNAAAVEALESCLQLDPHDADALLTLGEALVRLGRREDALSALRRSVRYGPFNAAAFLRLGSVLIDLQRAGEARAAFRRAEALGRSPSVGERERLERLESGDAS